MSLKDYKYDYLNLYEGKSFKDFTALCEEIIGEKPPTGTKNQSALKGEFAKYFEFRKACELNSSEKSSRKLIITEVFESPRSFIEMRGRDGKYANCLDPLLLMENHFAGKADALLNELGVFSRFFNLQMPTDKQKHLQDCHIDPMDISLWRTSEEVFSGLRCYKEKMASHTREVLKNRLKSLEKDGLLKQENYRQILPFLTVDIEGTSIKRFQTEKEIRTRNQKRIEFFNEITKDPNVSLTLNDVCLLDITTEMWDGFDLSKYKELVAQNEMYPFALRATRAQEEALTRVDQFLKQYAMKELYGLDHYPPAAEIPPDFFRDFRLSKKYRVLAKTIYPWLIGCKSVWQEIEYEVTASEDQVKEYLSNRLTDPQECADELTKAFIAYMDSHMEKIEYVPTETDLREDSNARILKKVSGPMLEEPLSNSKAACALHGKLKALYDMK